MNLKQSARDLAGGLLSLVGATRPARRGVEHLSIATFHRVLPAHLRDAYPIYGLCVTPEELDWFLGYFDTHYTVGPLRDVHRRFRNGERPTRPFLALTFDDGQADNHRYALPVLRKRGMRASFYIPVAHVDEQAPIWHDRIGFALLGALESGHTSEVASRLGGPLSRETVPQRIEDLKALPPRARARLVTELESFGEGPPSWAALMDWDQIRALSEDGHEIGSHSMSHPLLPQCNDEQLRDEVVRSKSRLEEELGASVQTFCYPNGDSDERVQAAVRNADYECAVTTTWGRNGLTRDPFGLRRFDMHPAHAKNGRGEMSSSRLAWRMSGMHPGLKD